MSQEFGNRWSAIVSGAIYSHAVERAPLPKSSGQFPVIIFSHGLGSTSFNYTCLIEDLVSQGYVVASIEHTYTALAVWFPDGRIVVRHQEPAPSGLTSEQRLKWMMARASDQITEGSADIRFVLDRLMKQQSNTEGFFPKGKVDLSRIAAMGHSAGADFAARACQLDTRIGACVDLDGEMLPVAALPEYPDHKRLKQPLLLLEAFQPESQMIGTPAEHAAYFKKKEEQLQASRPGSYDVVLRSPGLAHPGFSDIPLLFAGQDGFPPRKNVLHNLERIERYVREFLGKTLRGDSAPLLDTNQTVDSEATVHHYGH